MIIPVTLSYTSYTITVERGALAQVGSLFNLRRRVLIVTDSGVPANYAMAVANAAETPITVTVDEGEESKSLAVYEKLLKVMLDNGFTRSDCVVAVGGGVVGDLAGFVAASYMRGVDFYNIPTTLLAQVDSSIGGKTAINFGGVKNIVGAFYQPKAVLIDPDLLNTLSPRIVAAGLAEALKMAMTSDPALFAIFEEGQALEKLDEVIVSALLVKKSVVEEDEKEAGLRKILNFGHTIGHGIESEADLHGLYHGECVALGMIPMCAPAVRERLIPILTSLGLPTKIDFDADKAYAAMLHDKKSGKNGISVVRVEEIGRFTVEVIGKETLRRCLDPLVNEKEST